MNSAKRSTEIPKRPSPAALPLRLGMPDGSNAHLVYDANGVAISSIVIGSTFGVLKGMTVEQARQSELTAEYVKEIEYMINAVNSYETLVGALQMIYAVSPNKTTAAFAKQALVAAGEMKE
ncbi:hypothetical protein ACHMW6_06150 [Pseudoduganella sp. UC29_106]|uniref:hypothetical protein n=1 Tax=Pseudoduganella sp. UC29_106 TaxID=3374553 RepID=UPI00375755D5